MTKPTTGVSSRIRWEGHDRWNYARWNYARWNVPLLVVSGEANVDYLDVAENLRRVKGAVWRDGGDVGTRVR